MIQFQGLSSRVDAPFWMTLAKAKLDAGLDSTPIPLSGFVAQNALVCSSASFTSSQGGVPGTLVNVNTLEEFKSLDKTQFLNEAADKCRANWSQLRHVKDLNPFWILSFADLKRYRFYYWFAFVSLVPRVPFTGIVSSLQSSFKDYIDGILEEYRDVPLVFIKQVEGVYQTHAFTSALELNAWKDESTMAVYMDSSNVPNVPGWGLRNVLYYLQSIGWDRVKVLCYRWNRKSINSLDSFILQIELDSTEFDVVGWEMGSKGSLAPRMMDLSPLMDPKQ